MVSVLGGRVVSIRPLRMTEELWEREELEESAGKQLEIRFMGILELAGGACQGACFQTSRFMLS